MIEIKTGGEALDLPGAFSIEIEDTSPIFNDRGSQSVPATVPATRRNIRLLEAPHRIDAGRDPNAPERVAEVIEGAYYRRGKMNVTEAGGSEGITFNIGFDNSTAYAEWQKKKLTELPNLPTFTPEDQEGCYPIDWLLDELYRIYRYANPQKDPFAVFPIAVNKEEQGTDQNKKTYWEVFNLVGNRGLDGPTKVSRVLDGEVTEVTVPSGYAVTPFLRVWRVLELVFDNLGLSMPVNPFKDDRELARLVVLNNAADASCLGVIKYSDVLPDCTVEEFLNALWVRFGLVYNIDYSTGSVSLRLLKDILRSSGGVDLTQFTAGREKITYENRQYLRLSAATSIEGAAPSHERFEDFTKGLDTSNIRIGADIANWSNVGTQEDPRWDGDVYDDYYDPWDDYDPERDYPDPNDYDPFDDRWDDGRDDDRDDDQDDGRDDRDDDRDYYEMSRAAAAEKGAAVTTGSSFLAREFITGTWFRLDASNNKVRASSSSFFNWDPKPDGHTALDLTSDDECVPIGSASYGLGTQYNFSDKCPLYLVGARHYHSYIVGSDEVEEGNETPLAFMFAYTTGKKTIGRLNPEGTDGKTITLDDGTQPTLSLLFQFHDGLFAKFWRQYDEILRHGNRSIEVPVVINPLWLNLYLNPLNPVKLKNIRCLIDTSTYSLPAGKNVPVSLKLRTMQTQGTYNIDDEQNIPNFSAGSRHLEWRALGDFYIEHGDELDTLEARRKVAQNYISCNDYQPHGTEGEYYCIDHRSAELKTMMKLTSWENDTTLTAPTNINQKITKYYKARLTYYIYEILDMSVQGSDQDWERDEVPRGEEYVDVQYTVILAPKWVDD